MFVLRPDDISQLRLVQKTHKNKRDYVKATTILMLAIGDSPDEISSRLGISLATVYRYQKLFIELPFDEYLADNYLPYSGKLTDVQCEILKEDLTHELFATTAEIKEHIEHTFHIEMACSSIASLMERLGFSYKKTKIVPGKACPDAQADWVVQFNEYISQLSDNEEVFFIDGVHPMHNTKSEYGWIPKGKEFEILANCGRSRMNINGAINVLNPSEVFIHEDIAVNSQSNIALFEKIMEAHPDKIIRVYSDNAGYNKSNLLKEWLTKYERITLHYIPTYSPNLNPIERLWKFMKKKVINSYYYPTFAEFKKNVLGFFENIKKYTDELESLITLKFNMIT
jgi:transposase